MKSELERAVAAMKGAVDAFPWADADVYARWLEQTYFYVRHSTRLLAAASARFQQDPRGDVLHYRFAAHIREERKHEQLALTDLKRLGHPTEGLIELPATKMFYEPQYYKVNYLGPITLFGYILPLEAVGPECGQQIIDTVTAAHTKRCASFVQVHANEDPDHLEKAFAILEQTSELDRALIVSNIEQTAYGYVQMLDAIKRSV